MNPNSRYGPNLPAQQQAIRDKCFHPTGRFTDFQRSEIEQSISDRFEQQADKFPDRLAVKTREGHLTYRQLNQEANRLARAILARCPEEEVPIALLLDQGSPLFAPIMAVLKAGRFFTLLDPLHPSRHTRNVLEDSRAGLILTNTRNLARATELAGNGIQLINIDEVDDDLARHNLGLSISQDAFSYLLYTSGSTGQPKGVLQTHRNTLHQIMIYTNTLHICAEDRLTLLASVTGQAVNTIFNGLLNGAAICPLNVREEGVGALAKWLAQQEITIYISASPLFRQFAETLDEEQQFPHVRLVRLASQTVFHSDIELYKKHFSPDCIFVNGLSSTESNRLRNYFIDQDSRINTSTVPVGYPAEDKEVLLLDEEGQQVGPGVAGEIVVRSRYLTPGYWGKPQLTLQTFQPDPEGGDRRTFATGDMGRMSPDGCLEHLGRKDSQLKIRGNRIEISEIESALFGLDSVREAAVVARSDATGNQRLTAYVVPSGHPAPTVGSLRDFLTETLPSYMVPTYLVLLDSLPQLPGGKVDRQALAAPTGGRPDLQNQYQRPRNVLEQELCNIWAQVLGLDRVGIRDDFLELGGDSLLAAALITRIQRIFKNEVPLAGLIQASTVEKLARIVRDETLTLRDSPLVPIQSQGTRPPFFCVHGVGGHVFGVTALSRYLGDDQPFYGLESPGRDGEQPPLNTVEEMADLYITEIQKVQLHGPYFLGSYSWGGRVAYEMAQQLRARGEEIGLLVMVDSGCPVPASFWSRGWRKLLRFGNFGRRAWHHSGRMVRMKPSDQGKYLMEKTRVVRNMATVNSPVWRSNSRAGNRYLPRPYPGKITYFWAADRPEGPDDRRRRWWQLAEGGVEEHRVPGGHTTILLEPHVRTLAEHLNQCLQDAHSAAPSGQQ